MRKECGGSLELPAGYIYTKVRHIPKGGCILPNNDKV